jgi:D-alanyl-D-alanine carboxypeptidase
MLNKYITALVFTFSALNSFAQIDFKALKNNTDTLSNRSNAAMLILVDRGDKELIYASGLSDKNKHIEAKSKDLFEIGSASKMFTAIAILQLVEQNKLSLQTTLDKIYPAGEIKKLANYKGQNYWNKITIAMLLNHTSGMIDYLNVYEDDAKAMEKLAIKGKAYSFNELTELAIQHGDMNFIPGTTFKYCNTGYIILGDIISKKSGIPWREYIKKNIFDKAKMTDTYFGSEIPKSAFDRKMQGYFNGKASFMPPTLASSAGEIVSNLSDLKLFLLAWQEGKLFSDPKTLQMQQTEGYHMMYPEQTDRLTYGYGLMLIDGFYGHGGQTFGYQCYVTYNPKSKNLYVVSSNDAVNIPTMQVFFMFEEISLAK